MSLIRSIMIGITMMVNALLFAFGMVRWYHTAEARELLDSLR